MPGRIQSVERTAAVLSLLGAAPDLALAEIAGALGLPRPTVHGLLATLVHVGYAAQDPESRRYALGPALRDLQQPGIDRHDLRSLATSWCDSLAARLRLEVVVAVPVDGAAEIVHHVFRPDDTPQRLRVGEVWPLHATGVGKALLAASVRGHRAAPAGLERYTRRTAATAARLAADVEEVRARGWAAALGEHRPEVGDVAVAVRGAGGLAVGVVAVTGPTTRLARTDGTVLPEVAAAVAETAAAVGRALDAA